MNITQGNNRLLKLADYLEQLPRGAINMDMWLTDNRQHLRTSEQSVTDRLGDLAKTADGSITLKAAPANKIRECGFAACAVGWACTIPAFHKAGFRLKMIARQYGEVSMLAPSYRGATRYSAIERFFSIDYDLACYMFDPNAFGWSGKPRPSTVARRIRKVVAARRAGVNPLPKDW